MSLSVLHLSVLGSAEELKNAVVVVFLIRIELCNALSVVSTVGYTLWFAARGSSFGSVLEREDAAE